MYRMLSFFDLEEGVEIADFEKALKALNHHLIDVGLLQSAGNIGQRSSDTAMDTDDQRSQQWFFVSTFVDKEQCDRSYAYIKSGEEPGKSIHDAVRSRIRNGIFSCWEDLDD